MGTVACQLLLCATAAQHVRQPKPASIGSAHFPATPCKAASVHRPSPLMRPPSRLARLGTRLGVLNQQLVLAGALQLEAVVVQQALQSRQGRQQTTVHEAHAGAWRQSEWGLASSCSCAQPWAGTHVTPERHLLSQLAWSVASTTGILLDLDSFCSSSISSGASLSAATTRRGAWPSLRSCFWPDCVLHTEGRRRAGRNGQVHTC